MELISLHEALEELRNMTGKDVDPERPIVESDVDSLELVEWFFVLQERTGLYFDLAEEEQFEELKDKTIREAYELFINEVTRLAKSTN